MDFFQTLYSRKTVRSYNGKPVTKAQLQELLKAATMLSEKLTGTIREKYAELPFIVYGPFEAPIYKVENKYRMRMVIKCSLNKRTRAMFSEILCLFEKSLPKNITISMDFNPSNI